MGWEERGNGRRYLYRSRRIPGRGPRREYLTADADLGALLAHRQGLDRLARQADREFDRAVTEEAATVLNLARPVIEAAAAVFKLAMLAAGFFPHKRYEWRRLTGATMAKKKLQIDDAVIREAAKLGALVRAARPAMFGVRALRPEDQAVLDRAAAGDLSVLPAVKVLLDHAEWLQALGSIADTAVNALVHRVAGDNIAIREAVNRMYGEHVAKLLADCGENPSFAERMAAIRAAVCWLSVHILETEHARYEIGSRSALAVGKQLDLADRRLQAALRALAVLRRLRQPRPPAVVAQLHVETNNLTVTNNPTPRSSGAP